MYYLALLISNCFWFLVFFIISYRVVNFYQTVRIQKITTQKKNDFLTRLIHFYFWFKSERIYMTEAELIFYKNNLVYELIFFIFSFTNRLFIFVLICLIFNFLFLFLFFFDIPGQLASLECFYEDVLEDSFVESYYALKNYFLNIYYTYENAFLIIFDFFYDNFSFIFSIDLLESERFLLGLWFLKKLIKMLSKLFILIMSTLDIILNYFN